MKPATRNDTPSIYHPPSVHVVFVFYALPGYALPACRYTALCHLYVQWCFAKSAKSPCFLPALPLFKGLGPRPPDVRQGGDGQRLRDDHTGIGRVAFGVRAVARSGEGSGRRPCHGFPHQPPSTSDDFLCLRDAHPVGTIWHHSVHNPLDALLGQRRYLLRFY